MIGVDKVLGFSTMTANPMPQRRHISVWILLTAFVVGGVAGPSLHRVQHAGQQIADQTETPCHAPGVHDAEGPLWTHEATDLGKADCLLCATRLLVVPPAPAPSLASRASLTSVVTPVSHVASAHVAADRFIRGPPSLSKARPA